VTSRFAASFELLADLRGSMRIATGAITHANELREVMFLCSCKTNAEKRRVALKHRELAREGSAHFRVNPRTIRMMRQRERLSEWL